MNKEILNQLEKMKKDLSAMYDSLEVIRDQLSNETKEGTNKARDLIEKLRVILDFQADLIIYENRQDFFNLKKTNIKIKELDQVNEYD
jgi:hypothetical protein